GDLQISLQEAALLSSAFAVPYALSQLVFGMVGDAFGKVRVMRLTLTMMSIGLVACAIAPTHGTLMAARIFTGAWSG
ncbi:MFS transporter, partial [Klebsiella pneumoniae]|nr:MFS transporter [Klebsiella pneumoniae]